MNNVGAETSPQWFSPNVDQNLSENLDGTKGFTDLHPDKTNVETDSQYLIPDELLRSINLDYIHSEKVVQHDSRRKNITTHSSATHAEETTDENLNDKKSKFVIEDDCQTNKMNAGLSSKSDLHGEVDLDTEDQIITTPQIQELTTNEQRNESDWPDSQNTIPDKLLPSLNVYSSKRIIVYSSANHEFQTPVQKLRIRRPFKFKESQYTSKFASAAGSSAVHIRIFSQKHSFVYHPIDGIVNTKIVKKFMDWMFVNHLKVHAKRKEKMDHYKKSKSVIEMMHFEVETAKDKN
ncbi:hypothetical protein CQW23_17341 [Capsicum baccatum]|uniref:Uncharacterized protein n=1 Tax=Capsicum baccatum TaxID=33114 RepID=A0A2G2WDH2_CAPBA|nr:hypothetical protein CQW23_17341 [Capsicum baccatum]